MKKTRKDHELEKAENVKEELVEEESLTAIPIVHSRISEQETWGGPGGLSKKQVVFGPANLRNPKAKQARRPFSS